MVSPGKVHRPEALFAIVIKEQQVLALGHLSSAVARHLRASARNKAVGALHLGCVLTCRGARISIDGQVFMPVARGAERAQLANNAVLLALRNLKHAPTNLTILLGLKQLGDSMACEHKVGDWREMICVSRESNPGHIVGSEASYR